MNFVNWTFVQVHAIIRSIHKLVFIYLKQLVIFVDSFVRTQLYVDVVEGSKMTTEKLCKYLAEHGVHLMQESPSRSLSFYNIVLSYFCLSYCLF